MNPTRVPRGLRPRCAFAMLLFAACLPVTARAQHFVAGSDSTFPRIRYADSLVSVNDRCLVTQRKLNTKMPPVYVNGVPMGFC